MESIGIIYFNTASETKTITEYHFLKRIDAHVYIDEIEVKENNLNQLHQLYQKTKIIPKTSQPATGTIIEELEKMLEEFENVLILAPSSNLSGIYQNVYCCMEMLDQAKQNRVHLLKTRSFAIGEYIMLKEAINLVTSNESVDKIVSELEELSQKIATFIFPGDLKFLQKSGRVNTGQLLLGKIAQLKIMLYHREPVVELYKKARGKKNLLRYIDQAIKDQPIQEIYLGSIGIDSVFYQQVKAIVQANNIKLIDTGDTSIIAGSHLGPNSFGLAMVLK